MVNREMAKRAFWLLCNGRELAFDAKLTYLLERHDARWLRRGNANREGKR